jgi:hypothetical protein
MLWRVRVTILAVERNTCHILRTYSARICNLSYSARQAQVLYHIVIFDMSGSIICFNIIS